MPFDKSVLKDYIDVAERLRAWFEVYPKARIEPRLIELTDKRVVFSAAVYRGESADEQPAGTGHSAMNIPGSTPYTRGSEVENCETSAVGRALVMAGLPSKRIASDDEIRSKAGDTKKQPDLVVEAAQKIFLDDPAIADWVEAIKAAGTKEELQQIGQEIVGSSLDADQRKALQVVWKNRAGELA
jgi:hypothetical protein